MNLATPAQLDESNSGRETHRIRVAFVVHVMQVAGAEILVRRLIRDLEPRVHPLVFCLDAIGRIGHELIDLGIEVVCLDRRPGIDWSVGRRIAELVNRYEVDILHAHQYSPFFYSALSKVTGRHQAKIVFTEHGRHFPDVVSAQRRLVNRFFLQRYADATNACCDFSARAVERNDGFSKVETTPNGIDVAEFQPVDSDQRSRIRRQNGIGDDEFCVACVARFHPIKDHSTLLRAWSSVVQQTPHARLLLVGDGSERPAIEELAKKLQVESSVSFLGIRSDIKELLQAADVFAMASLSEASSLTLLEAMACGCPPVITDVGGNGEHIRDGVEGRLVPRQDPSSLAAAIVSLSDSKMARKMGTAARDRVTRDFQITKTVASYSSLYERVLTGSTVTQ